MLLERILWLFLQSHTMSVLERLFEYKQCWEEGVEPLLVFLERNYCHLWLCTFGIFGLFGFLFQLQKKVKIFTTLVIPLIRR